MKIDPETHFEHYVSVDHPTNAQWQALMVRLMDCYNWVVSHPKRKAKFKKYLKEQEND